MRQWIAVLAGMLLSSCATSSATRAPRLVPLWTTTGLANPESLAVSADGTFLYVSNVAGEGEARDGNGFVARLARDGTILQRDWATGLDAPKGLALAGDRLYVADIAQLVELDAATGRVRARIEAPGASFLNDVAIAPDGTVLVADSGTQRIYGWRDARMDTWLEHELLGAINGLLVEPERLVVTTMRGKLLAVDWRTRAITVLASDLGDADGVAALGGGAYLVGEWPGRLFHVRPDGAATTLLDTRAGKQYVNDFLLLGDTLVVPNWEPSTVRAYRVER